MQSYKLQQDEELQDLRDFQMRLGPDATIVDFEESMLNSTPRTTLRVWREGTRILGFGYIDDFHNLWFETLPDGPAEERVGREIIEWGENCLRERHRYAAELNLDSTCRSDNGRRIQMLERNGFARQEVRTLGYARLLAEPLPEFDLPEGFTLRPVRGEPEVEALVVLHRAAFGTENMTIEGRLSMMHAPGYVPELDLLAVAPDGVLAAFCICGFKDEGRQTGYTDPVGTHPRYQHIGLGKALIAAGMRKLMAAGATRVELGTSSENLPMRGLAEAMGFELEWEQAWFSESFFADSDLIDGS